MEELNEEHGEVLLWFYIFKQKVCQLIFISAIFRQFCGKLLNAEFHFLNRLLSGPVLCDFGKEFSSRNCTMTQIRKESV